MPAGALTRSGTPLPVGLASRSRRIAQEPARLVGEACNDLGLSPGSLVQVERAREPGDDIARDVDSNDPAESRFVTKIIIRSGLADRAATPIGAEPLRL